VGTIYSYDEGQPYMVVMDASGNIRWSVPNETPQIATSDGGVIAESGTVYDQNGNATTQFGTLPTYSWKGAYKIGSIVSTLANFDLASMATTFAAVPGGNFTGNGFSLHNHTFGLKFCGAFATGSDGGCTSPIDGTDITDVSYSYLNPPPQDIVFTSSNLRTLKDFSAEHPDWVYTIKKNAHDAFKAGFANFPAIISQIDNHIGRFDHTVMISGYFHPQYRFGITLSDYVTTVLYYLSIMASAPNTMGLVCKDLGSCSTIEPIRPTYGPNMTAGTIDQFKMLVAGIGTVMGVTAVHEVGHHFSQPNGDPIRVLNLDCNPCSEPYVYERDGFASLSWAWANIPNQQIKWTEANISALAHILLKK
jgi:hypothetical protein